MKRLKKKFNPTRISIKKKESIRWLKNLDQSNHLFNDPDKCIHIGDRESDIYGLFCKAKELNTHFIVRTCVDRLAEDGKHTITNEMNKEKNKRNLPNYNKEQQRKRNKNMPGS